MFKIVDKKAIPSKEDKARFIGPSLLVDNEFEEIKNELITECVYNTDNLIAWANIGIRNLKSKSGYLLRLIYEMKSLLSSIDRRSTFVDEKDFNYLKSTNDHKELKEKVTKTIDKYSDVYVNLPGVSSKRLTSGAESVSEFLRRKDIVNKGLQEVTNVISRITTVDSSHSYLKRELDVIVDHAISSIKNDLLDDISSNPGEQTSKVARLLSITSLIDAHNSISNDVSKKVEPKTNFLLKPSKHRLSFDLPLYQERTLSINEIEFNINGETLYIPNFFTPSFIRVDSSFELAGLTWDSISNVKLNVLMSGIPVTFTLRPSMTANSIEDFVNKLNDDISNPYFKFIINRGTKNSISILAATTDIKLLSISEDLEVDDFGIWEFLGFKEGYEWVGGVANSSSIVNHFKDYTNLESISYNEEVIYSDDNPVIYGDGSIIVDQGHSISLGDIVKFNNFNGYVTFVGDSSINIAVSNGKFNVGPGFFSELRLSPITVVRPKLSFELESDTEFSVTVKENSELLFSSSSKIGSVNLYGDVRGGQPKVMDPESLNLAEGDYISSKPILNINGSDITIDMSPTSSFSGVKSGKYIKFKESAGNLLVIMDRIPLYNSKLLSITSDFLTLERASDRKKAKEILVEIEEILNDILDIKVTEMSNFIIEKLEQIRELGYDVLENLVLTFNIPEIMSLAQSTASSSSIVEESATNLIYKHLQLRGDNDDYEDSEIGSTDFIDDYS